MATEPPRSGETTPQLRARRGPRPEVDQGEGEDYLAPSADHRLRAPVVLALVAIELAALMLPKRYRSRYDREFIAELYEMDSREQIKFAACVLMQAWHLRAVLRNRPPLEDEDAQR